MAGQSWPNRNQKRNEEVPTQRTMKVNRTVTAPQPGYAHAGYQRPNEIWDFQRIRERRAAREQRRRRPQSARNNHTRHQPTTPFRAKSATVHREHDHAPPRRVFAYNTDTTPGLLSGGGGFVRITPGPPLLRGLPEEFDDSDIEPSEIIERTLQALRS